MRTLGTVINTNSNVRLIVGDKDTAPAVTFAAIYEGEICHRSMALVLAWAVKSIFPTVKLVQAGCDEDKFWYDFDFLTRPKPQDVSRIEAEVGEILHADLPFARHSVTKQRAQRMMYDFGETYKALEASAAPQGSKVVLYSVGDFWDLTDGPMVPSTGYLEPKALNMYTYKSNGKTVVRIEGSK